MPVEKVVEEFLYERDENIQQESMIEEFDKHRNGKGKSQKKLTWKPQRQCIDRMLNVIIISNISSMTLTTTSRSAGKASYGCTEETLDANETFSCRAFTPWWSCTNCCCRSSFHQHKQIYYDWKERSSHSCGSWFANNLHQKQTLILCSSFFGATKSAFSYTFSNNARSLLLNLPLAITLVKVMSWDGLHP